MERLRIYLEAEGIDEWGVCPFAGVPMLPVRSRNRIPLDAQSIVVVLFGYYTEEYPDRNVSRYAIADDYHTVLLPKLQALAEKLEGAFQGERFVPFTDASPVAEVAAARMAGLGDVGMNGTLLNPVYGSYCLIGELVTTMAVTGKGVGHPVCTHCGACVAACPTGALTAGGFTLDKCRSHITQKKGALAEWERAEIRAGGMAWGCDRCTDACPVNRAAQKSRVPAFYENRVAELTMANAAELCKIKSFGWRGQSVVLRNLSYLTETSNDPSEQ